jgi:hypothetical protein
MNGSTRDAHGRPSGPLPTPPEAKLAEIRRLYYQARPGTIAADLARAIAILISMATEEERERAAVYLDGLSQMRAEWKPPAEPEKAAGDSHGRARGRGIRLKPDPTQEGKAKTRK